VNAGHPQRRRRIDRPNARVRMRAAHETAMEHAGQFDIVDKARAAGEERRVLDTRHPCAELLCAHGRAPAGACARKIFRAR